MSETIANVSISYEFSVTSLLCVILDLPFLFVEEVVERVEHFLFGQEVYYPFPPTHLPLTHLDGLSTLKKVPSLSSVHWLPLKGDDNPNKQGT